MEAVETKEELLRSNGYKYNYEMMHYVNRKTRKVFSVEFIQESDPETIEASIKSEPPLSGWQFFFIEESPSDSMKVLLEQYYEKGNRQSV